MELQKLLDFCNNSSGGLVNTLKPLLEILVSITGATYELNGEVQAAVWNSHNSMA